jgi:hypothetical protein
MEKKNILELHKMTIDELKKLAIEYKIDPSMIPKQQLIYKILSKQSEE